jgi:predicted nucleic acid-binding protein
MMMPDANLLIAFTWEGHPAQAKAESFFREHPRVATCPLTELALVRVWMQKGASARDADKALGDFVKTFRARLIPANISATKIAGFNAGHQTTTDSYLAMLARKHGVTLATLDEPLANRFPGSVEFVG